MRKALKTQAYRLSPPSSEMIVGPAVDTMVTSMKASRSPASRPARMRVTVLRECNVSAGASRSVVAREMSSAISFGGRQHEALLTRFEGVATHNEKSDRPLLSGASHPSHRTVPRRSSPAQIVAIYFVDSVKLQTRLGLENGHLRSCLGCESAPIHEK